jgi:hypothetical protein
MRFSRWSALPEKMISTRQISAPTPIPHQSWRAHRITASSRMGKLRQGKGRQLVAGSLQALRQRPFSESNYPQAFAKA